MLHTRQFPTRCLLLGVFLVGTLTGVGTRPPALIAAGHGRIVGAVSDQQGNPLMGATVMIIGPSLTGLRTVESRVHQVITDANGKFAVERLVPGWYSLQVTSPTRLPVQRNRVRVDTGGTSAQNFVLGDILSTLRVEVPRGNVSNWGEDWKWVLRTSASTRPVLRYQEVKKVKASKRPRPASQRLIGMMPAAGHRGTLSADPGLGSVLAYLRPLSADTDLLVAGLMGASGLQASSLAAALRKDIVNGDPQELALVVHQLSFAEGVPLPSGEGRESLRYAQALVLSYAHTRRISASLTVMAGMEIDYLNAARDVMSARSHAKLDYQVSPSSVLTVHYGAMQPEVGGSLMERVGALSAFPRLTMHDYRPRLERVKHAEVSYRRAVARSARFEMAAYRDHFQNAAVWGYGSAAAMEGLAGDFLPNPASDGVTLNAGDYSSSGARVAYIQDLGGNVKAVFFYALGDALAVVPPGYSDMNSRRGLRAALRPRRTHSLAGRLSAVVPGSRTQVTTSYEWLPDGRVTGVDPYGQSGMQLQPYLGIQIRQPLPPLAFLPARIEALADFRNLLAQGYVPVAGFGEDRLLLTPVYRSFRGGFAVQF